MTQDRKWIQPLGSPPLLVPSRPLLAEEKDAESIEGQLQTAGVTLATIDLAAARTTYELFQGLKKALVFPDWCGSDWNSFDDAFAEILSASPFPIAFLARGLQELLGSDTHLALERVISLDRVEYDFSVRGAQFMVIYLGRNWAAPTR